MNDNKSKEYILLTNLELKIDVLPCCPCLLSLNAMSLSLAVDARRLTKFLANKMPFAHAVKCCQSHY